MDAHRKLITRYYEEIWNHWREDLIPEIISPVLVFHGSLGTEVRGIEDFRAYMQTVRSAFPDFHNKIEEMTSDSKCTVVRVTYTGTHQGPLFGIAATGKRVRYSGVATFHFRENLIASGWVLGDTESLWRQIGQPPITPPA